MASSAMAEFARMPPQKKVAVFVGIAALLALGYWKLIYKSLSEDVDAAQADHDSKVATNQRLADDIPRYAELRARMDRLRELIEKNQTALPSGPELPAFFETLQHKAAASGVVTVKSTPRPEEPVETFFKVPVDIEMTGTFMQIKRFFASLVQSDVQPVGSPDRVGGDDHERIVSIENLSLGSPTVRSREIQLTAKFTAVTFRQQDKADVAPTPGAPATPRPSPTRPAVPPPPSSPAAEPPPLPSAATPAGARARTEDALDKGDHRNRAAAGVNEARSPGAGGDRLKGGL
jgi:Tfp pilus assembly protein PilO